MSTEPDFGAPLRSHRGTFAAGGWLWYLGGVSLLAGFFMLLPDTPSSTRLPNSPPPPVATFAERMSLATWAFGAAVAFLALPVLRLRQVVEVHEFGFVWRRLLRGPRRVHRGDVTGVTLESSRSNVTVVVARRKGFDLRMVGLKDADQLARFVAPLAPPPAAPAAPLSEGADDTRGQSAAWVPGSWQPPASGS